jgi:hypothetical protein
MHNKVMIVTTYVLGPTYIHMYVVILKIFSQKTLAKNWHFLLKILLFFTNIWFKTLNSVVLLIL